MTKSKYEKDYLEADKYVVLNDNDPDLRPIVLSLPKPPPIHLIDGYGLPIEEQKFRRLEIPRRLVDLEAEAREKTKKDLASNKNNVVTLLKIQKTFWELLYSKHKDYKKEIDYIRKFWWHRTHGYWTFIYGKPYYLSGQYFFYLNMHTMNTKDGSNKPNFRMRDWKEYIFEKYCMESTETFARIDEDGYAIKEEDGHYEMIDTGDRVCFGKMQPKHRRSGNTNKAISNMIEVVSRNSLNFGGGIQSFSNQNAKETFDTLLMPCFDAYPIWIKPNTTSGRTSDSLKFNVGKNEYGEPSLQTQITYATTANEKFYDSKKMMYLLVEEAGKCFGIGTQIKMHDGTLKAVEDIVVGDSLMGDDSKKRVVTKLFRGRDLMYRIKLNKGDGFVCNKEHILSLMYSANINGHKTGEKLDIPLKDYINLPNSVKKSLVMYRTGVDYDEKQHRIPPYLLGVWLGDGNSSGGGITTCDDEIVEYICGFAKEHDMKINRNGIVYYISQTNFNDIVATSDHETITFKSLREFANFIGKTESAIKWAMHTDKQICGYSVKKEKKYSLRGELDSLGLLNNKHIPYEFMYDSRKNRLLLLAGLIDTDGYAPKRRTRHMYEITQKNKSLANDINKLALDLGFYSSINTKIARMKREDGSVYECEVFRVSIYGNELWEIPCILERKRYDKWIPSKRSKNPLRTGFSIEEIGNGNYYGFSITGNRRFLLHDNIVVHNTDEVDVAERHEVTKHTLSQAGTLLHGYCSYPSTVSETSEGAAYYRALSNTSDFYRRLPNGQTYSGLFRLFIPADDGNDRYIDPYGRSVKGELTEEHKKFGFRKTATEEIMAKRDAYIKDPSSESNRLLRNEKKLFPMKYEDCWLGEAGDIGFNMENIDSRLAELRREDNTIKGRLEWVNGIFMGAVEFVPDEEHGRFEISERPREDVSNKKTKGYYFSTFEGKDVEMDEPLVKGKYVLGADPFRFGNKQDERTGKSLNKNSRLSDGGIAVFMVYDEAIDGGIEMNRWHTHKFVLSYRYRPSNTDEYCEDVIKAAVYYGAYVYPETNVPVVYEYFIRHKLGGYLLYDVDRVTGQYKKKAGVDSLERSKQDLFSMLRDYIEKHCHREDFASFLTECKTIRGMEQMRHFDRLTAHGMCLLGSKSAFLDDIKQIGQSSNNLEDYIDFYDV